MQFALHCCVAALPLASAMAAPAADWKLLPPHEERTPLPTSIPASASPLAVGDSIPDDPMFRWLVGELAIPATLDGQPTTGLPVGLRFNCGDGGELYVNGRFQARFDNDSPALAVVAPQATPGARVRIEALIYAKVQGSGEFGEAAWTLVDPARVAQPRALRVDCRQLGSAVHDGLVGLSQGGGMADYDEATAAKLREGGFRWFRMDNVLTNVLRRNDQGDLVYDWTDFDQRLDFMARIGAEPILAASYMPQVLDAVENHDRQSAPRDYGLWEELCFRSAERALQRNVRVAYWEVWNEVNTGWLKPGPADDGDERFHKLYNEALGRLQPEQEVIRRFEAYCKLYQATVQGVRRADPEARFGGPALASGPFENDACGHCFHGRGFARGLMAYCAAENLPLDFLSWHEYFQPWQVVAREAQAFRAYLRDYPTIEPQVKSLMITEWNQAWWADRPHDHELGAAWCADSLVRACLPNGVDRPCFFYVKQGDDRFRGDFSLLMNNNVPKASYNVFKIFNGMSGQWLTLQGGDDDLCGVASWDPKRRRLAVVLVNYRDRYGVARPARLRVETLPSALVPGRWREYRVDGQHSNAWHDLQHAELEQVAAGQVEDDTLVLERTLPANSVTLLEIVPAD